MNQAQKLRQEMDEINIRRAEVDKLLNRLNGPVLDEEDLIWRGNSPDALKDKLSAERSQLAEKHRLILLQYNKLPVYQRDEDA